MVAIKIKLLAIGKMNNSILASAEKALLAKQQLPSTFGSDAVCPSYEGLGLANIAALAMEQLCPEAPILSEQPTLPAFNPKLLGVDALTSAWEDWLQQGPINHMVLLIMDGLGYDQLRSLIDTKDTPELAIASHKPQAFFMPATSVYPSTTVTALTSAATSYAPAQHGIMGTNIYFREIGSVVNLIGFCPKIAPTSESFLDTQLNPDTLLPVPNIYLRMEKAGIDVEIINFYRFRKTSISRYTSADSQAGSTNFKGYMTAADAFAQLRQRLSANSSQTKSFTYIYLPNVDGVSHRYGPLTPSYRAEIAAIDFALKRELLEPLAGRNDTVMLLTADHGQRQSFSDKILWLEEHPDLTKFLSVPAVTGESRVRFLHLKHGAEAAVVDYIQQKFSEHFLVVNSSQAVELGLFGIPGKPMSMESQDRIGDLLVIPRGEWISRQQVTQEEHHCGPIGIHGGLSRAEMLTPFLAYRF